MCQTCTCEWHAKLLATVPSHVVLAPPAQGRPFLLSLAFVWRSVSANDTPWRSPAGELRRALARRDCGVFWLQSQKVVGRFQLKRTTHPVRAQAKTPAVCRANLRALFRRTASAWTVTESEVLQIQVPLISLMNLWWGLLVAPWLVENLVSMVIPQSKLRSRNR
jgi:hypothetical protein